MSAIRIIKQGKGIKIEDLGIIILYCIVRKGGI